MITVSPELLSLYQSGGIFQFSSKLQILDRQYKLLAEYAHDSDSPDKIFDGTLTADNSRLTYRSFDLKLTNIDGQLTWGSNNLIWLDKYFKPYFGVMVNGEWEWIPQGVFPCSMPIATSGVFSGAQNEVEFQGGDKMDFLGQCADAITVKSGTDIATAITSVLSGVETLFNLDDTATQATAPYDINWAVGTDYSQIISDLAGIITWKIYYDVDGYLRLHAPIDPTTTAPLLTLSGEVADASKFTPWAGSQRQMDDSGMANYIVVYGGSSQTALVSSIVQDNDPMSPTSVQNIGKRIYLHNSGNPDPVITTQALADARANYEYKNRLQVVEKLNFSMIPVPFMDIDHVYQATDSKNGTAGKYQVISFSLPFGSQSATYHTGYLRQVRNFA